MTNSYNSYQNAKIILIHGLNNNTYAFEEIDRFLKLLGYETEIIVLPMHEKAPQEVDNVKKSLEVFNQRMRSLGDAPFYALAFSHGALYLELWMRENPELRPIKQVLLAPAFFIKKQKLIQNVLKILPDSLQIKSLAPKRFRRFNTLSIRSYRILFQGMEKFQRELSAFSIPTLIIVDPEDELVDGKKLKKEMENTNSGLKVEFIQREYLKNGIGRHHILFHPDYFTEIDWTNFLKKIINFLEDHE